MKIVAVRKNEQGDNEEFKLDNGSVIGMSEAIEMCNNGELPDYNVGTSRSGSQFIRGNADGDASNNLDNMPSF